MNPNSKITDLSYLVDASGGNEGFVKEMIEIFLNQTPSYIKELNTLSEKENWEDFRKVIHKFKPTTTMMGITEALEYVKEIEHKVKNNIELDKIQSLLKKLGGICEQSYIELKERL